MRLRVNRRFIVLLFSYLALISVKAQTLYWVGGSGNFNDPKHWSLTSGGTAANRIPNASTDVVFDDNSGKGYFLVNLNDDIRVRDFSASAIDRAVKFTGNASRQFRISGSIYLFGRLKFEMPSDIVFESSGTKTNDINIGIALNNNLSFRSGSYNFITLQVSDTKTIRFGSGKYNFNSVLVTAGNIVNEDPAAEFTIRDSYFKTVQKFKLASSAVVRSENMYVMADIDSPVNYEVPATLRTSKTYTSVNSVNALCPVTISLTPACTGSCTGVLTVSLSPTCTNTPYSVQVSNGTCPAFAAALSNTNIPSVYTVTNACACSANYIIVVRDGSNTIQAATNTANFTPNSAIIFDSNVSPQCSYSCDGSLEGLIIGTPPFTVSVVSSGTTIPAFTTATGEYTISNMCEGTYTFNITDGNGCYSPQTNNLTAPPSLSTNPVTSSIVCNGINTGSFSISPAGGTPNYTVNFSNSTTLTTNGSAVAATGLGIGAISATVTDSHGCKTTASGNIIQPAAPLNATYTQTDLVCNSVCIGGAAANVSGGTPPYNYAWTPASGSSSVVSGLCAGTQTLNVSDFNGCTIAARVFTITQPPAITVTPSFTNVVCSGSCTGVASVAASGGSGPFTFIWVAPGPSTISAGSTNSLSGLCAGIYTVYTRDASNCSPAPVIINLTQPPAVTLTAVSRSISCFGANNGGATVTASGGNGAPYSYSWTPGAMTTSAITNLGPNNYSVTVRDASNCPTATMVTIVEPSGLVPTVTHTDLTCNSINRACDGRINAMPVGGVLPYSYTLASAGSTINTAPPYNNLCAGNYSVIVRDASGCPQQSLVTLAQPGPLLPTISTTSVSCFGANTGGLTGNSSSGGTAPYTLTWITPTGTATGPILSNQPAGNYTLTVTDSKTCTAQATATVTQPSSITISVGTSSISCYSMCNGVLSSTVTGGTPGYNYAWTNSMSVNVGGLSTVSSLCPGAYTLTVTDANLCSITAAGVVMSPPPIVLTATTTPVSCFGNSNGSATVTASGGTPTYTYSFSSSPTVTNTTGVLTGQPAGSYTATITDFAGCVQTITFAIASPGALAASLTGSGSCNVCTGTATLTPSFGTAPYSVAWASSAGGSFPTTTVITNLCPGSYTATLTDSKGCVITRSIALQQVINISINLGGASILCNGASTGSATALASGGTGAFTYSWSPSAQTGSVLTGVTAGSYTVRVTDTSIPSSCSHTAAVTLTQPPAITVTATQTNVSCYGFSNGAITTSVSGGTPGTPVPYSYTWSPGGLNTSSITGIPSGTYVVNVRDGNLCPASRTISVTQPSSITIALAVTNPAGCVPSLANGSICATPSGGSGSGYTYTLSPIGTTSSGATGCFTGLGGGAYSIIVNDGLGCSNTTVTTLSPPSGPTIAVSATSVTCFGYSTAVASATATGLTPSFTFSWTPAVTFTSNATTTRASNLPAGVYFVTAVDGNSCVATQSVNIGQATAYTLNPVVSNLRCNNISTGSIVVAPAGGSPAYTYTWFPGGLTGQNTATVSNLAAGVYTLNLSDTHTCVTPYTFTVTQPPSISLTAVTSSLLCYNVCTGSIVANATGGTGSINYSWTPVGGNSPTVTNLCANSGTNPASYTLTVTDQNTCTVKATYTITQPAPLSNTVNVLSATCSNSCNAVATQTASGGVPGYSYSWLTSTVTTSTLGSLCAGTYTAVVTDANGCSASNQYTVVPPAPLSVTLTPSNPLCNAACNGSISTLVSGAQGTVGYVWAPSGSGQNPTGLCATTNPAYTLVATDQNSCRVTAVVTLTNPPALLASVSGTNPLCHNNTNGLAAVSVTNAVGATSYTWLPTGPPTQTTQVISGLAAGPYTVLVKDANNCQASRTFTLINPSALVLNTSINPASCSQSNGSITVNPSGGTPGTPVPYTYTWTGSASTSSVATALPAGSYTVNVADGLGCTSATNILLSNSSGPNLIPVVSTSLSCNAQCTGAASVDISGIQGGTAPYVVNWQAPAPSTLNPLTNLCAGVYTARIEDFTGCIGYTTVTISEPPPLQVAPTVGLPLCPGICSGSITLNTSGGLAPYTYSWMPFSSSSSVVTNLCAGDYTVEIGYNGVCSATTVVSLPDQSSITIVPTVTNNVCFGTSNGIVSVAISGGTSPYSTGWSNGQTGALITNLSNGTYTAIVTDNNGCSHSATTTITSGPQLTSTASVTGPSCGMCNGSASVSTSGGTAPLSFNWSNAATTPTVTNLCAGIYQVVITDALSCSETHTVVVNNSNGITAENFTVQQIPCSGSCVGAATVNAVGGTAPITYNWTNPAVSNSVITGLCPGTYFVQMSDAAGCMRFSSVTINPAVTLSVSPFVFQPSCGASNGSISIVISGGTPTYNVVWNPPAGQTTSLTNLTTGVYSYTVTESGPNSCSLSQTINVSNANGPAIDASQTNVNCYGQCTGSITASSGSTSTPLTYAWSTGASVPNVSNLCKGIVTLTVTDAVGCTAIRVFTITDNPLLQLGTGNVHHPTCYGDCDGSITLLPTGGSMPYTYSWTSHSTSNPVKALCDGVYSASITDAKGCVINSPSYTIRSASSISLSAISHSSSCTSVADGSLSVMPSGGTPEYTYLWNGPSSFTATTPAIGNIFSGDYTVHVKDDLGCKKDSVLRIIPSITVVANAGFDKTICPGTGSVVLNANGSAGSAAFKWYALQNRSVTLSSGPTLTVDNISEQQAFILVVSATVPSCTSEDTILVNVFDLPGVDAGKDVMVPIYSTVTIGGHPTNWGAVTLTWSPAMYLNDANISNPVASNTVNVTYTLTVTDNNGCVASDTMRVMLYPELKISSGFTPNGDGKNDLWIIDYIDQFPATTVEIFNRWGDLVFSSDGYQEPFDGKYKGSELPVGTYYYIIKLNHPGYPKPITGPLTIFR